MPHMATAEPSQRLVVEILKDGGFLPRVTYAFETLQQGTGSSFMGAQGGSVKAQAPPAILSGASTTKNLGRTPTAQVSCMR
jgi:hypothetical protein